MTRPTLSPFCTIILLVVLCWLIAAIPYVALREADNHRTETKP